jgi:hypothetical protein
MEGGESRVDAVPRSSPFARAGRSQPPGLRGDRQLPTGATFIPGDTSQDTMLSDHDSIPEGHRGGPTGPRSQSQPNELRVGVHQGSLVAARELADRLAAALRSVESESRGRVVSDPAELASLREQLGRLESRLEQARRIIDEAAAADDLNTLVGLLNALAQRPTDILVMAKLSEQAGRLVALAEACAEVRRLIEAS